MTAAALAMEVTSRHDRAVDGASCDPARAINDISGIVCPPPDAAALGAGSLSADFDRSPTAARNLRLLFQEQRRFLNYFFEHVDYDSMERFAKECMACRGVVLFTGVGKSGFIAQKISQTLVSTGTKAMFLSPTDALHGDIGIVGPADLLIALSKSGSSEELLKLMPYARAKGARLVAVTSVRGCKLEACCDVAVLLPLERELCPFDLAPVTSTAIQMLFGDTVAIALMQAKHLTQDQYAMNHPAGRIGKRLTLRVADVMVPLPQLPLVRPTVTVLDALAELSGKGHGCVLITSRASKPAGDTVLLGAFTDGDLRRSLQRRGAEALTLPLSEVMTSAPRTCRSDLKAVDAMQAMETPNRVTFLPVVDDGLLVGLVSLHGLVTAGL